MSRLDDKDRKILTLLLDRPCSVSFLSEKIGLHKSNISRRLKRLKGFGLVTDDFAPRGSQKFYRLTDLGRSVALLTSRSVSGRGWVWVHNFRVSFDVVGVDVSRYPRGERGLDGQVVWRDGGYTFYLSRDRTLTVVFPGFQVRKAFFLSDLVHWYSYHLFYSLLLLREKYGIEVDIRSARVSRQEFADPLPEVLSSVVERDKWFKLGKPAYSVLGGTSLDAYAGLDLTPVLSRETNDLDYEELLILEPIFALHTLKTLRNLDEKLVPAINDLTEQIRLHLDAVRELRDAAIEIRRSFRGRSRLGMYIGIVFRLLRLGLLHKYIFWKARYGSREARRRLLLAGYEYRLHQLLRRLYEAHGSVLLVDIGAPPYEKARYARWYVAVDVSHDDVDIKGPEDVALLTLDMAEEASIKLLDGLIREKVMRYDPSLVIATVDIEGNASEYLIEMLRKHADIIILEIHPGTQEERFRKIGREIDAFPDGTIHILIGGQNGDWRDYQSS